MFIKYDWEELKQAGIGPKGNKLAYIEFQRVMKLQYLLIGYSITLKQL